MTTYSIKETLAHFLKSYSRHEKSMICSGLSCTECPFGRLINFMNSEHCKFPLDLDKRATPIESLIKYFIKAFPNLIFEDTLLGGKK